jgi:hypothetical protein
MTPAPWVRATKRGVALAVALSLTTGGTGLPMCLSLLAQAIAPCTMHQTHHEHGTTHTVAHSMQLTTQTADETCHTGGPTHGCAAGGVCPGGGSAAFAAMRDVAGLLPVVAAGPIGAPLSHVSYVAPPPSPPPQA